VEEPNDHLFFPGLEPADEQEVTRDIPVIDTAVCTFCRKCAGFCTFNAILVIPSANFAEINPSLCHSCGACTVACEEGAIFYRKEVTGQLNRYDTGIGCGLKEGKLSIGSRLQTMVIRELLQSLPSSQSIQILDAPPGTSCPVVETIAVTDYLILVTEPTPFGQHDLELMVDLAEELQIPFGVIVNKAGLGTREIYSYLDEKGITLLGEIPFNRDFAAAYAEGRILSRIPNQVREAYREAFHALTRHISLS
jgi:MinD superfamily P-loop ATPase